jgi:transposase
MSETFSKVEVITGVARRRRFTTEQKLPTAHYGLRSLITVRLKGAHSTPRRHDWAERK